MCRTRNTPFLSCGWPHSYFSPRLQSIARNPWKSRTTAATATTNGLATGRTESLRWLLWQYGFSSHLPSWYSATLKYSASYATRDWARWFLMTRPEARRKASWCSCFRPPRSSHLGFHMHACLSSESLRLVTKMWSGIKLHLIANVYCFQTVLAESCSLQPNQGSFLTTKVLMTVVITTRFKVFFIFF